MRTKDLTAKLESLERSHKLLALKVENYKRENDLLKGLKKEPQHESKKIIVDIDVEYGETLKEVLAKTGELHTRCSEDEMKKYIEWLRIHPMPITCDFGPAEAEALQDCQQVNILGTSYNVYKHASGEDEKLSNKDGYCDFHKKLIVVLKCEEDRNDIDQCENIEDYERKIMRHEIVHAFLYESGLDINSNDIDQWAKNEEMIDWIAIQFSKMLEVFKQLDCL